MSRIGLALILLLAALLSGCGNAVSSGTTIALTGFDLRAMAEQMTQSITADPEVQAVLEEPGPMRIVVLPVRNRLTGEVLPPGQQQAFVGKLRVELARARPQAFTWIMNRDDFYKLRARELETGEGLDLGPAPEAVNPEYALQATFRSLTKDTKRVRSSYYSCLFELTDLQQRTTLWTDDYQVKKSGSKGFLD